MRANWRIWAGFLIAFAAAVSYLIIFVQFPLTRDFPWANLLLFLAAGYLLAVGLRRTFAQPGSRRAKTFAVVMTLLSVALCAFFWFGVAQLRQLPSAPDALAAGRPAPDFHLTGINGQPVSLSTLRQGKRAVLLIFYRGYW